jgi:2-iminobutanoate/2-iminopropanoate deaminase
MRRSALTPEGVASPTGHFSQGVLVEDAARVLYVAGQVGFDEKGELVGRDDPAAQADQAFTNLRRVVEAAGGRMEDVAKTTIFLVDLDHRQPVGEVRERFFPHDPPANTLLVVSSLARPDLLVEVEAIVPLA